MFEIASRITDAELVVMRVLWDADRPLNITEIRNILSKTSEWNGETMRTLLRRLCDKGAVKAEKRKVFYYTPVVSDAEYEKFSTQSLLDKLYSGSAKGLVAALVKNKQLGSDDIEELRALFKVGDAGE